MTDIDKVAQAIRTHQPKVVADDRSRPGYRIWLDGCAGCEWVSRDRNIEDHAAHVAQAAIDALELTEEFGATCDQWVNGRTIRHSRQEAIADAQVATVRRSVFDAAPPRLEDMRLEVRLVSPWVRDGEAMG